MQISGYNGAYVGGRFDPRAELEKVQWQQQQLLSYGKMISSGVSSVSTSKGDTVSFSGEALALVAQMMAEKTETLKQNLETEAEQNDQDAAGTNGDVSGSTERPVEQPEDVQGGGGESDEAPADESTEDLEARIQSLRAQLQILPIDSAEARSVAAQINELQQQLSQTKNARR